MEFRNIVTFIFSLSTKILSPLVKLMLIKDLLQIKHFFRCTHLNLIYCLLWEVSRRHSRYGYKPAHEKKCTAGSLTKCWRAEPYCKWVVNECYLMRERTQKISTSSDSCHEKNRTESEGYRGVQTFIGITENNLTEVHFTQNNLLEHILSPDNLNKAYKQVVSNHGSGGVDGMETDALLPWLRLHKDEISNSYILARALNNDNLRRANYPFLPDCYRKVVS